MSKRIEWIDVVKGLAIILVIVGHTIHPRSFSWIVIFTFHMPIFFIISGFLYKPRGPHEIIAKKSKRLLIPYFSTCFLLLISVVIINYFNHTDFEGISYSFSHLMLAFLYGNGVVPPKTYPLSDVWQVGMLWFLLCLFLAELLFSSIMMITKNKNPNYFPLAVITTAVVGYVISHFIFLPWNTDLAMIALVYLYIGYEMRKISFDSVKIPMYIFVCMILFWIQTIHIGGIEMSSRTYPLFPFSLLGSICASILFIQGCKIISKVEMIKKPLAFLGSESLIILCFHQLEINLIPWYKLTNLFPVLIEYPRLLEIVLICLKISLLTLAALYVKKIPFIQKLYYIK